MKIEQILKVLKAERECIRRPYLSNDGKPILCFDKCSDCPNYLPDDEKMEVLDFLINGYELLQNEGAESYSIRCDTSKLSQEEIDDFISKLKQAPNNLYVRCEPIEAEIKPLPPDVITKILGQEGTD